MVSVNEEVSGKGEKDSVTYRLWEQEYEEAKVKLKKKGKWHR